MLVVSVAVVVVSALAFALLAAPAIQVRSANDDGPQRRVQGLVCLDFVGVAGDAPSIVGSALLTQSDLEDWWASTGHGQPAGLTVEVGDLISYYLDEAETEGIRGDLAFAQAVLETGYFTNDDTRINNFAGIAHYDDAESGVSFEDARTGVRAQVQLLLRFAEGNDVQLAGEEVAPEALESATTWDDLAGTWASDRRYWTSLSQLYRQMLASADYHYLNLFLSPDHC